MDSVCCTIWQEKTVLFQKEQQNEAIYEPCRPVQLLPSIAILCNQDTHSYIPQLMLYVESIVLWNRWGIHSVHLLLWCLKADRYTLEHLEAMPCPLCVCVCKVMKSERKERRSTEHRLMSFYMPSTLLNDYHAYKQNLSVLTLVCSPLILLRTGFAMTQQHNEYRRFHLFVTKKNGRKISPLSEDFCWLQFHYLCPFEQCYFFKLPVYALNSIIKNSINPIIVILLFAWKGKSINLYTGLSSIMCVARKRHTCFLKDLGAPSSSQCMQVCTDHCSDCVWSCVWMLVWIVIDSRLE